MLLSLVFRCWVYWKVMLLRMTSGMVPSKQSISVRATERKRPSSIWATYSIQSQPMYS